MNVAHRCHATGCTTEVPTVMLMCHRHWDLVPGIIRRQVWKTYRPGQTEDGRPSAEWHLAADAAVGAVARAEGRELTQRQARALNARGLPSIALRATLEKATPMNAPTTLSDATDVIPLSTGESFAWLVPPTPGDSMELIVLRLQASVRKDSKDQDLAVRAITTVKCQDSRGRNREVTEGGEYLITYRAPLTPLVELLEAGCKGFWARLIWVEKVKIPNGQTWRIRIEVRHSETLGKRAEDPRTTDVTHGYPTTPADRETMLAQLLRQNEDLARLNRILAEALVRPPVLPPLHGEAQIVLTEAGLAALRNAPREAPAGSTESAERGPLGDERGAGSEGAVRE